MAIYVRRIGNAICATKLSTGNFVMGTGEDAAAILHSCNLTVDQLPCQIAQNDDIGLMLLVCGDEI